MAGPEVAAAGPSQLYDVLVVGGGPAGLTAALFLGRSRRRVLVIDDGQPRNARSRALHGFPTRDGIAPLELLRLTREEVGAYGVGVHHGRVVSARPSANGGSSVGFVVTIENGDVFGCRRLLLATGVRDVLPDVEGMLTYYGRGVFHCPYCDGWEVRDRRIASYGDLPNAARLATHLLSWSPEVTLLSAGVALQPRHRKRLASKGIQVYEQRVARLEGGAGAGDDGSLEAVVFADGSRVPIDALFLSVAHVQRSELPKQLGCRVDEKGEVKVGRGQRTGVPGLFLAGDAVGDVQFAVKSAAEGAKAAVAIHKDLEKEDRR